MALFLIMMGLDSDKIYFHMGEAEFQFQFLQALKLTTRIRQMQAGTLISSIGSFLVKKGQKTIIEEMQSELEGIDKILGIYEDPRDKNPNQAFDKLFAQVEKFKRGR